MWTAQKPHRSQLRYPSDLTDEVWAHIFNLSPHLSASCFESSGFQIDVPGHTLTGAL
jgi:hypothetical protein